MNITSKSRYALKIMMDLAMHYDEGHQQRQAIASRQRVPLDFMDQITSRLRSADLIESIRGRSGGFQLTKTPAEISLCDILYAVEDSLYPVKCLENEPCDLEDDCISAPVWNDIFTVIKERLMGKSLDESIKNAQETPLKPCRGDDLACSKASTVPCGRPRSSSHQC